MEGMLGDVRKLRSIESRILGISYISWKIKCRRRSRPVACLGTGTRHADSIYCFQSSWQMKQTFQQSSIAVSPTLDSCLGHAANSPTAATDEEKGPLALNYRGVYILVANDHYLGLSALINQPTSQPTNQSINQSTSQSVNQGVFI